MRYDKISVTLHNTTVLSFLTGGFNPLYKNIKRFLQKKKKRHLPFTDIRAFLFFYLINACFYLFILHKMQLKVFTMGVLMF